jgi:hypothetical protein
VATDSNESVGTDWDQMEAETKKKEMEHLHNPQ